jgi:hypothetical protein
MIVRIESIRRTETVLVIEETGKYLGQMESVNFFADCLEDKDPFEEDEYLWYFVDKECLMQNLDK